MAAEIIMPKLGMDMEEGTIVKWIKELGDSVNKGEPLIEVLTDKVNMEIEAEESGILLDIIGQEGEVVPVFDVIGYIGELGEEVPVKEKVNSDPMSNIEESKEQVSKKKETMGVRATPAARKIARDKGITLENVKGSGPLGRIQRADVEAFKNVKVTPLAKKVAKAEAIDISTIKGTGVDGKIMKSDLLERVEDKKNIEIIPMVGIRKIIAHRMKESLDNSAPVTLDIEVDMSESLILIKKLKPIILQEINEKITITDMIILATVKSLLKYPIVNATLLEEGIKINDFVNIGLAVGLDEGLLVPVIKEIDKKSLRDIVASRSDLVARTLSNKVSPDELNGSTFTISNLGMYGITGFNSIINQPNSAILSVGKVVKKIRVVKDEPVVMPVMNMSITLDHKIMDGVKGAKFLQYLKGLLEEPSLMLL